MPTEFTLAQYCVLSALLNSRGTPTHPVSITNRGGPALTSVTALPSDDIFTAGIVARAIGLTGPTVLEIILEIRETRDAPFRS